MGAACCAAPSQQSQGVKPSSTHPGGSVHVLTPWGEELKLHGFGYEPPTERQPAAQASEGREVYAMAPSTAPNVPSAPSALAKAVEEPPATSKAAEELPTPPKAVEVPVATIKTVDVPAASTKAAEEQPVLIKPMEVPPAPVKLVEVPPAPVKPAEVSPAPVKSVEVPPAPVKPVEVMSPPSKAVDISPALNKEPDAANLRSSVTLPLAEQVAPAKVPLPLPQANPMEVAEKLHTATVVSPTAHEAAVPPAVAPIVAALRAAPAPAAVLPLVEPALSVKAASTPVSPVGGTVAALIAKIEEGEASKTGDASAKDNQAIGGFPDMSVSPQKLAFGVGGAEGQKSEQVKDALLVKAEGVLEVAVAKVPLVEEAAVASSPFVVGEFPLAEKVAFTPSPLVAEVAAIEHGVSVPTPPVVEVPNAEKVASVPNVVVVEDVSADNSFSVENSPAANDSASSIGNMTPNKISSSPASPATREKRAMESQGLVDIEETPPALAKPIVGLKEMPPPELLEAALVRNADEVKTAEVSDKLAEDSAAKNQLEADAEGNMSDRSTAQQNARNFLASLYRSASRDLTK